MRKNSRRGSILILALWVLSFLTIISVNIGLRIRQKINLISRIETRSQLHHIASAGIKKAISALKSDLRRNNQSYTPSGKEYRHNNTEAFNRIEIGEGEADVFYNYYDWGQDKPERRFGIVDEEGKINLNTASAIVIMRLIGQVLRINEEEAQALALAIVDWREMGKTTLTGFYSDEYYQNLQFPYQVKNAHIEIFDELLLIKGIDEKLLSKLTPFVTIYGSGEININTASAQVLYSMGFDAPLIEKIMTARRGNDGEEATNDDFIFQKTFDIASDMLRFVKLDGDEIKQLDYFNSVGEIKTNSFFYSIRSEAIVAHKTDTLTIECVYNVRDNRIEYWREKY